MAAQLHVEKVPGGYAVKDMPEGAENIGYPAPAPIDHRATDRIARYLALAQAQMQNPAFDAQNPHFKNRYSSLASVRNAVIPVLAKYGIALVQEVYTEDGQIACVTHLYHESGQSLAFRPLKLPVSKQDAQGFGSAATYARRYALMAVAGVVGDADDDAEGAVGRKTEIAKITKEQRDTLEKLLAEVGSDAKKLCAHLKLASLADIAATELESVTKLVESKRRHA